jgi:chemotaxis protein histidine kinase CheA
LTLTRQTTDLRSFAKQAEEHEHVLRELLACDAPPELDRIRDVTRATRALRGSASLIGLDAFQAFLGRLFALLVDVESSELPWSADLGSVHKRRLERRGEAGYVATRSGAAIRVDRCSFRFGAGCASG